MRLGYVATGIDARGVLDSAATGKVTFSAPSCVEPIAALLERIAAGKGVRRVVRVSPRRAMP